MGPDIGRSSGQRRSWNNGMLLDDALKDEVVLAGLKNGESEERRTCDGFEGCNVPFIATHTADLRLLIFHWAAQQTELAERCQSMGAHSSSGLRVPAPW
jgi:hypothetical protein